MTVGREASFFAHHGACHGRQSTPDIAHIFMVSFLTKWKVGYIGEADSSYNQRSRATWEIEESGISDDLNHVDYN